MFDKTPLNRLNDSNGNHHKPQRLGEPEISEVGGVRRLLADITELAELQGRLIVDDVRESLTAFGKPIFLVLCSAVIALGTMPVILMALASFLVSEWQWAQHAALFACGGAALLLACLLAVWARLLFSNCTEPFRQSLSELKKNLATVREMLVRSDHTSAKRSSRGPT